MNPRMTDVVLPPTFEQTASAGSPTPGPWTTRLRDTTITIYGADGIQVLETSWHTSIRKSYPLKAEAIANAKFAAASHLMFEALTQAEIAVQDLCNDQHDGNECWNILRKIQAAIAAAKAGAA